MSVWVWCQAVMVQCHCSVLVTWMVLLSHPVCDAWFTWQAFSTGQCHMLALWSG